MSHPIFNIIKKLANFRLNFAPTTLKLRVHAITQQTHANADSSSFTVMIGAAILIMENSLPNHVRINRHGLFSFDFFAVLLWMKQLLRFAPFF